MNRNPDYDLNSEYVTVDLEGLYLTGYFKCPNRVRQALGHASPFVTVSEGSSVCLRSWLTLQIHQLVYLRKFLPLLVNLKLLYLRQR